MISATVCIDILGLFALLAEKGGEGGLEARVGGVQEDGHRRGSPCAKADSAVAFGSSRAGMGLDQKIPPEAEGATGVFAKLCKFLRTKSGPHLSRGLGTLPEGAR